MSTSVFLTQIYNQTIMVNSERKTKTPNIAATKLIKLLLTFLICRYIQFFPPPAEAACVSKYIKSYLYFLQLYLLLVSVSRVFKKINVLF